MHVTCADAWNGKALVRDGIRNRNKNLLNSDGPNLEHCHPEETYARSKLQIAFSNELQRRMKVGSFVSRSQVVKCDKPRLDSHTLWHKKMVRLRLEVED